MSRLAALLALVAAFAPAAVLGALPLVLLTTVSVSAMMAAVVLALPQHDTGPVAADADEPVVAP